MSAIRLEKRTLNRAAVAWGVHARDQDGLLPRGMARDVSTTGMFFELSSELPKRGARLMLRIFPAGSSRYLDLAATVRWAGFSPRHQCYGVGVAFDIVAAHGAHPWAA